MWGWRLLQAGVFLGAFGVPLAMWLGLRNKLTGTVSPAGSGRVTITMTRLAGKTYKAAGTVMVNVSGGRFSYSFEPKYKGSWYFMATYPGGVSGVTTYRTSKSVTNTVKVK